MAEFISADISKISSFESGSAEAVAEFSSIRDKFESINSTLLGQWKGEGTDHILENIGGIKDILDSINNSVVKDIKDYYLELDNALGEFNRNPQTAEGNEG